MLDLCIPHFSFCILLELLVFDIHNTCKV
jgi:hypothetical protein